MIIKRLDRCMTTFAGPTIMTSRPMVFSSSPIQEIAMLNQPTSEKLQAMKLHGMANGFQEQMESADINQLSFEERLGLLVDRQWTWKEGRALTRRLQLAKFKERAVIEDINYQHPRGLDRKLVRTLSSSEWVRQHHNILFIGPTGIGKTWLACALAH